MSEWREEAIGEIAYYIDKYCTGGGDNDFKAAELALDAILAMGLRIEGKGVTGVRELWGVSEIAAALGIRRETVDYHRKRPGFPEPAARIGDRLGWEPAEIRKWREGVTSA